MPRSSGRISRQVPLAKLTVPSLPRIIERRRLFRQLDQARKRPIVWITGPPGSGKTTLVASYLHARKLRSLWYQVDEGDADPATFFHYLGLAGRKAAPRVRSPLPHLTPEYLPGLAVFTRRFFENLFARLRAPVAVVFDNYQTVPNQAAFHDVLAQGLSEVPAGISVIVLSRGTPPPALARLQAEQRMAQIGEDELWLTAAEATHLVSLHARTTRKPVPRQVRAQLVRQSQGWVAGLVLLLEQLKTSRAFDRASELQSPEVLFEYLAREVLKQLDPETQGFLLKSAFCPSMTAKMAEKLTDLPGAGSILEQLYRSRYFTERRPGTEPLYQYHPLFREFLAASARQTLAPASLSAILGATASLLEQAGQINEAVALLLETKQYAEVARIILAQAPALLSQGRGRVVEDWIRRLPVEVQERNPWLLFWLGNSRLPVDPNDAAPIFERAYHRFTEMQEASGALLTLSLVIQAISLSGGEFQRMEQWLDRLPPLDADRVAAETPALQAGLAFAKILALFWKRTDDPEARAWLARGTALLEHLEGLENQTAMAWYLVSFRLWLGDFAEAEEVVNRIRRQVASRPASPLAKATCLAIEAQYHWLAGNPAKGLQAAREGLALAQEHGLFLPAAFLWPQAFYAAIALGDRALAEQYVKDMEPVLEPMPSLFGTQYHYMAGWLEALRGEYQQALQRVERCSKAVMGERVVFIEVLWRMAAAQVFHEVRRTEEAEGHLSRAEEIAKAAGSFLHEFQCRLIRAQWAFDGDREAVGLDALRQAMAIGRAKRLVNFSWWWPEVMARLCGKALEAGIEPDYVRWLIRARRPALGPPPPELAAWPWPVKVTLLGRFAVQLDDKPLPQSRKASHRLFMLLQAIVAFGGREVPMARVTDALWPEAEGDAAYRALISALARLRKLLGDAQAILFHEGRLSLGTDLVWVDALAFETLAQEAERMAREGCAERSERLAEQALQLYRGSFLADESEAPWAEPAREKHRARYLRLVEAQVRSWMERGEWDQAVACAEEATQLDTPAEPLYRLLMTTLHRAGRAADLPTVYARCRKALIESEGRPPSPETERLYESLRSA